jgi:hypothetical protein
MALDLESIPLGSDVYTQDGEHLGRVKELRHDYLNVDARLQLDYWLPLGLVATFADGRVTMDFAKDQLDEHKADLPGEETDLRADDAPNLRRETGPETQSDLYIPDDRQLPDR